MEPARLGRTGNRIGRPDQSFRQPEDDRRHAGGTPARETLPWISTRPIRKRSRPLSSGSRCITPSGVTARPGYGNGWGNEDVLAVNDPLGRFKGYCVVLGDGGVAYGLGVYLGDRGLLNYLSTMTSEDEPCGVEALERGLALTAVLGDREELENEERKAMRDLGLRYRGRGRWPIFRSAIPGALALVRQRRRGPIFDHRV